MTKLELKQKVSELAKACEAEGYNAALVVLLVLKGALGSDDEVLLAENVQEFAQQTLLPLAKQKQGN